VGLAQPSWFAGQAECPPKQSGRFSDVQPEGSGSVIFVGGLFFAAFVWRSLFNSGKHAADKLRLVSAPLFGSSTSENHLAGGLLVVSLAAEHQQQA
jgi:hypothetical protein